MQTILFVLCVGRGGCAFLGMLVWKCGLIERMRGGKEGEWVGGSRREKLMVILLDDACGLRYIGIKRFYFLRMKEKISLEVGISRYSLDGDDRFAKSIKCFFSWA